MAREKEDVGEMNSPTPATLRRSCVRFRKWLSPGDTAGRNEESTADERSQRGAGWKGHQGSGWGVFVVRGGADVKRGQTASTEVEHTHTHAHTHQEARQRKGWCCVGGVLALSLLVSRRLVLKRIHRCVPVGPDKRDLRAERGGEGRTERQRGKQPWRRKRKRCCATWTGCWRRRICLNTEMGSWISSLPHMRSSRWDGGRTAGCRGDTHIHTHVQYGSGTRCQERETCLKISKWKVLLVFWRDVLSLCASTCVLKGHLSCKSVHVRVCETNVCVWRHWFRGVAFCERISCGVVGGVGGRGGVCFVRVYSQ